MEKVHNIIEEKTNVNTVKAENILAFELNEATFSLVPSKRKMVKKTKVLLGGRLTIANVKTFTEHVKSVFENYDEVDFFFEQIESLDLSYLQVMSYVKTHYEGKGKKVTIDADLSPDMKKIFLQSGFNRFLFQPKLINV